MQDYRTDTLTYLLTKFETLILALNLSYHRQTLHYVFWASIILATQVLFQVHFNHPVYQLRRWLDY
jgi:hypothetical protein